MTWRSVSRARPCELCGRPDYCSYADDDSAFVCRRIEDCARRPFARRDKVGAHYYLYIKDSKRERAILSQAPQAEPEHHAYEIADADTLDAVYRRLLELLPPLEPGHHLDLTNRGYLRSEIEALGFRSWPRSSPELTDIGQKLLKQFKRILLRVPGFFAIRSKKEVCERCDGPCQNEPTCSKVWKSATDLGIALDGCGGYVLPVLDPRQRIVALQIRRDEGDEPRYLAFSSSENLSCGGQLAVHVPDTRGMDVDTSEVWLTEGVHKANRATRILKKLVLGLPFVGAGGLAFPMLEEFQPKRVVLAFDADARSNSLVAGPLRWMGQSLAEQGHAVALATWTLDLGKGLDDMLRGGHREKLTVIEGMEVWRTIRDLARAAKAPDDPLLDARILLSGLPERAKSDSSIAFRSAMVSAAARVARHGAEGERFLAAMKEALPGRFTAWSRAVEEAGKKLGREERQAAAKQRGKVVLQRGDHAELSGVVVKDLATEFRYFDPEERKSFIRTVLPVSTEGALFNYDDPAGVWKKIDHAKLSCMVQDLSGSSIAGDKELHVFGGTVDGTIKCLLARCAQPGYFDGSRTGVAFRNGFVELGDDGPRIRGHHPDHRARFAHDFDYTPGAKPERFLALLHRAFQGEKDAAEKVSLIQEFVGAARFGLGTTYQKVLLFFGPFAKDGKTTIASIIARTMPPGSCSNVRPDLMSEKFQLAPLVGAHLNYVDEVGTKPIDRAEVFKQVVTAKAPILVEKKGVDPFMATISAAHLVLGNHFPLADDPSDGFLRRWMIVGFFRPVENVIATIENDIIKAELPAIVSWSIEGAARLVRQGSYTEPSSSLALHEEWRKKANPVLAFVSDVLQAAKQKSEWSKLCDLHVLFTAYAHEKGYKPMAENTLGSRLRPWRVEDETGNFYALMPREKAHREAKQRRAEQAADEAFAAAFPVTSVDPQEDRADDEAARALGARYAGADDALN